MNNRNTRLVLCEASGPLKTLLNNLSGEEGELWLTALKRMLRKESPFAREWKVWKTIQTKIYSSMEVLYETIRKREGDCFIQPKGIVSKTSETLNLVVVSMEELGFSHHANLQAIYKQAHLLGLSRCPDDLPWQLRWEYTDQPKGERLHIATFNTFPGGLYNNPCIATVGAGLGSGGILGVSEEDTVNRHPFGNGFSADSKFVFCLRS
ncbi:MAG: hypothetical protein KBB91_02040 [Candidatus Pacebacteria bacterium]|nr:hypothetical protein [Candidatus Paceibacterota bacterium]